MADLGGAAGIGDAAAVDLTTISTLIDKHELTERLCVGYGVRVVGLFLIGGFMAAPNSDVKDPLALVQTGIAAARCSATDMTRRRAWASWSRRRAV